MVSVNIPTIKNDKYLPFAIESVKNQLYQDVEIIINDEVPLSKARQEGIKKSQGKYIMFLDSDQILDPEALERCVSACEWQGYDGVTLFEKSLITHNTFIERVIAFDKEIFHSLEDDDPVNGTAVPRFYKKEFLDKVDYGANPPLTLEDAIVHYQVAKMGAKIKFVRDAVIYHPETHTLKLLCKKFFRYGYFYIDALRKFPELSKAHARPRRTYFTRQALSHPILWLGLWYVYLAKSISAICGAIKFLIDENISNRFRI